MKIESNLFNPRASWKFTSAVIALTLAIYFASVRAEAMDGRQRRKSFAPATMNYVCLKEACGEGFYKVLVASGSGAFFVD